jgi:hypothetical protein
MTPEEIRLLKAIAKALDIDDISKIKLIRVGNSFERDDGMEVLYFPMTPEEFEALRELTAEQLTALGMVKWDDSGLMLLPYEWYTLIPEGSVLVAIDHTSRAFNSDTCAFSVRRGLLPYGFYPKA